MKESTVSAFHICHAIASQAQQWLAAINNRCVGQVWIAEDERSFGIEGPNVYLLMLSRSYGNLLQEKWVISNCDNT